MQRITRNSFTFILHVYLECRSLSLCGFYLFHPIYLFIFLSIYMNRCIYRYCLRTLFCLYMYLSLSLRHFCIYVCLIDCLRTLFCLYLYLSLSLRLFADIFCLYMYLSHSLRQLADIFLSVFVFKSVFETVCRHYSVSICI